jgi:two-component system LytT family response regulator
MTKLRILIVDDEILARNRLRLFLSRDATVEIVGECGDGLEALATIRREQPDIVFLDVQMPRCNGFEVVEQLAAERRPEIIFVTAHDRFAVDAFATKAIDYLLKPFHGERLQQALARAIEHINIRRAGDLGRKLETLLAEPKLRAPERLAVRTEGRVLFIKPSEILWIEAANNYCILHLVDARRVMQRDTLTSVEQRLGSDDFARINRSAVVRIDQVKELHPVTYGDYVVMLQDGTRLPLSRNLRCRLEKFVPDGI